MLARTLHRNAGLAQEIVEVGPYLGGERHGGHVARVVEGLDGGKRSAEALVGVAGLVAAEASLRVEKDGARVDEALVEREAVDEGLERGAGASRRAGAVDFARNGAVEEIDAAHLGEDGHVARVDDEHRAVFNAVGAKPSDVLGEDLLHRLLKRQAQRGLEDGIGTRALDEAREVRGLEGKRSRAPHLEGTLDDGTQALAHKPVVDRLPAHGKACTVEVRPRDGMALDGVLGHDGERDRLGGGELRGVLAEVDERGGLDALDVAAIGRQGQIGREDLVLGVVHVVAQRPEHLLELAAPAAGVESLKPAGELHGDGRAADAAGAREGGPGGSADREGIDAGMRVEEAVLVAHDRVKRLARHRSLEDGEPVGAVLGEREVKEAAVAVGDGLGPVGVFGHEPGLWLGFRPDHESAAGRCRQNGCGQKQTGKPSHEVLRLVLSVRLMASR